MGQDEQTRVVSSAEKILARSNTSVCGNADNNKSQVVQRSWDNWWRALKNSVTTFSFAGL